MVAAALAAALSSGLVPLRAAVPVAAGTAETMESSLLGWINDARAGLGLAALRLDAPLADLAGDRAAKLAATNTLSHDAAGCLKCQLGDRGIAWNLFGEALASNSWPWGPESARVVFESWRGSAPHWDILVGSQYDSIGIGVALAAGGTTYASAVLIDAPGPVAATPKPKPAPTPAPVPRATPRPTPRPTPAPTATPTATPAPTPPPLVVIASPCGRIRNIPL
ncbi:MAG TPA: CAP domain-containing protein [Candidatus Limnocylindrales bacterium]|nr:CAP domain-containing protein [Candidatus Limnocylindrales bacterium]